MLIKKLFRTAWSYRAQFISMVIMVVIGVGVFLGLNIEWKSLESDALTFLEDTNYADFRIYSESGFSEKDIEAIQKISGVKAATRYFNANVTLKDDTKKSLALNVSENYTVSTMLVTNGAKYDEQSDGIWLSDKFAKANDIKIGDQLTFTYKNFEMTSDVVGLAKSGENLICVADENQLMPDYKTFGFAYITPQAFEKAMGIAFYPQINVISDMKKSDLEKAIKDATGTSFLVAPKDDHYAYAGVKSEVKEGQTMGSILPVLFLAIGILTMVTTMHRISANEKVQIGTLKALGFRDSKILWHYTSYGFTVGLIGILFGVVLGYVFAKFIISPSGMMGTYVDMPSWDLLMPQFCIPVLAFVLVFLTLISFLSVKKMLKGTAADALRPYTPKAMKKNFLENSSFWDRCSFGVQWNIRNILRHKSRSIMTLLGVIGCTVLLIAGIGMKDTMSIFLEMMDHDISKYATKVILSETTPNEDAVKLAKELDGDWQSSLGVSYKGKTISLEIYNSNVEKIGFLTEENTTMKLENDGVYLCLRLKDTANIGDTIEISPYGSKKSYKVKVAGYFRSLVSESIVMSDTYAKHIGIGYHIGSIYTNNRPTDIKNSSMITGKQNKQTIMDSYNTFMDLMNITIILLVLAAIVLGIVVLYNLGIMSYMECRRELATLKVLGFRDRQVGKLLICQNIWLTVIGVLLGIPAGIGVLKIVIVSLVSEYELSLFISPVTYIFCIVLIFGVSLLVGRMVARKNKKIDMVEALKASE